MINYNGNIVSKDSNILSNNNRAFKYGDALFETIKVVDNKVLFSEDHYFRLMASMRMLRMKISMTFTLAFFEDAISKTVTSNKLNTARVRFTVFRKDGGFYLPTTNEIDYIIEAQSLVVSVKAHYEIDLYKDYYTYSGLLSTLKTTNRILNVTASIYAHENELDNCILLNEKKQLVEALNANVFLVKGNQLMTPSVSEGCIKGIVRKKIIEICKQDTAYEMLETEISPFELQKVDEVFLTNTIVGIQSVTKYRKKTYTDTIATDLRSKLKIVEKLS